MLGEKNINILTINYPKTLWLYSFLHVRLWLIIIWLLIVRRDCSEADCAGDLLPDHSWHDNNIYTKNIFQAFVKRQLVVANQKTQTQKKTFYQYTISTSPKAPAAHCCSWKAPRANVFIKVKERLNCFQFLCFYNLQLPPPWQQAANTSSKTAVPFFFSFLLALPCVLARDFTQQKKSKNTAAFFMSHMRS